MEQLPSNFEQFSFEEKVERATSFEELFKVIQEIKEIKGESGIYTADYVIKRIEQIRHGHRDITFVTRGMGIRDKVSLLLSEDKVFKKYSKHN